MCQIGEPVKPFTCVTPKAAAARAVSFIRSAARCLDAVRVAVAPDLGREDRLVARVDRVADRLADEVRAEREAAEVVRSSMLALRLRSSPSSATAWSTSKWSPQQASSRPSKPQRLAFAARSSSGRSAHWPVKSVTGLAIRAILRRVGSGVLARRLHRRARRCRPLPVAVGEHQLHRRARRRSASRRSSSASSGSTPGRRASRRASRRAATSTSTRTRSRSGTGRSSVGSCRGDIGPLCVYTSDKCSTLAYGRSVTWARSAARLRRPASPAATRRAARRLPDRPRALRPLPLVKWGIISTADINRLVIPPAQASPKVDLVGVASRTQERADEYAAKWGIPRAYGSYEALLADPEIEAVYISLPNTMHTEWSIKSVEAGKHVLCEKPFTRHPEEVTAAWDAADRAGKLLSEAFMYRHNPQIEAAARADRRGRDRRAAPDPLGRSRTRSTTRTTSACAPTSRAAR